VIKGITPLVGFLTLFSLAIFDRSWNLIYRTKFLLGLILSLVILAVWLIPLSIEGSSNFLWDMVRGDLLPKLISGQQHHGMPPGYFVVIFPIFFWSAALFIWRGYQWAWQRRQIPVERFLIAWIFPTWIFFEIIPTKLPEYILPIYPA